MELESPNAGELDVLGVLWAEREIDPERPLQLAEVHRRVCQRRREFGEKEPAPSTVSTHLRKLLGKGLIEELFVTGTHAPKGPIRFRGNYSPPSRSPSTGYRVLYAPGQVLQTTFQGLAAAYPPDQRLQALLDFARALAFPTDKIGELSRFLTDHFTGGAEDGLSGRKG